MAELEPIHITRNQYRGVNAHLHSHLQNTHRWDEFHFNHIPDMMRLMSEQLLPLGYIADVAQSLQIRHADQPVGKPESDVTIYDQQPDRPRHSPAVVSSSFAAAAVAIPDIMLLEEKLAEYKAIGIYEYVQDQTDLGEPVAWIELLSPSNKPGGQDATYYHDKRLKLLRSGIVFVEIDYLHESVSAFEKLPNYAARRFRERELEAHPYHIVVVDPRPSLLEGMAYPYSFDVDDPIPSVQIPLRRGDVFTFDFGQPYDKTIQETLYAYRFIDYGTRPVNFDRYSEADQARIVTRMLRIIERAGRGDAFTEAPQELPTTPLQDGLDRLEQIKPW